jgi:2-amino-4-hydroxy-6-hydroxymethyldihydropteridine diphosphokinase
MERNVDEEAARTPLLAGVGAVPSRARQSLDLEPALQAFVLHDSSILPAVPTAYLGLGCNLGDRLGTLRRCVALLEAYGSVERVSSVYETAPVGVTAQPMFLNCVAALVSDLTPRELTRRAHTIERELGRVARERWGPREIDVDLLLYDDTVVDEPDLIVPHPHLAERAFVLVPLAEIAPEALVPGTDATVSLLLSRLPRAADDVVRVGSL